MENITLYMYKPIEYRVIDGDSIEVHLDLGFDLRKKIQIRVWGVDTPEKRGSQKRAGLPVKAAIIALLEGRTFYVESVQWGKYAKRVIGRIWIDVNDSLVSLTDFLLEHNLALPYGGKTKHVWTEELLDTAMNSANSLVGE
jgi:micrococcal nuclease